MTSDLSPAGTRFGPDQWAEVADLVFPPENPYLHDPVGWVRDVLGEFLWSKQVEVFEAVRDNRYVAVKSAHDTGKSHLASRLVAWWLATHEDPFATTTAPTTKQVHAILWRYIGQAHRKAGLDGRITLDDEWYAGPGGKELIGFGRKPADHDQSAFQGIHALNPLIVVDESCGVPKSIFDAVDALATNKNARVLAIGNPDDPASHFAEICKPGSGWKVITISAFDTPAWTGEEVPEWLFPLLIDPEWVDERKKRWGVTAPIYVSKVRGEFPDVSNDTLIQPRYIKRACERSIPRTNKPLVGADIARYGDDETVLMRREGGWFRTHRAHHKLDTMQTTGHIMKARDEINAEVQIEQFLEVIVDEDGVGGGVLDRLNELGVEVRGFKNGAKAHDPDHFVNRRAEMYWRLREMFEADEIDIDEADEHLVAQLGTIKWALDSRGRIKIESKDDMRKRRVASPDRADAMMMTLAINDTDADDFEFEEHRASGTFEENMMTVRW